MRRRCCAPQELREAYVDEACAGDDELKQQLEELLEAEQDATGALGVHAEIGRDIDAALSPFQPGQLILDRFRVVRRVGFGGMGEVYEAEDLLLGKVALKTVRADIAAAPEALRRLRQEVQLARKISGSEVCRIHEFFTVPRRGELPATAFISMEYIDGETLASRLHAGGPMPPRQALRVALAICEGLRLIHAQGVIHRDLKTTNIMLCGQAGAERTVLMDFGLAHAMAAATQVSEGSTASLEGDEVGRGAAGGGIVGTPAYMAPEQFEGREVSPATDVYALGIVLYEMLTGVQPYSASTSFGAAVRRGKQPRPASALQHGVPRSWDRIIDCCLQFEPAERYQSAEKVAGALRAGPFQVASIWNDRRGLVHGATAMLLCAVAWLAVLVWQSRQIYRPSAEAAHFYADGTEALKEGTYLKATRSLTAAVERDPEFAMAHVRLAEAWNSLDFQASAQHELLLAMPGERRITSLNRMELQAVRSEVTGDFAAARNARQEMIAKLAAGDRSAGYVELGFQRERGGEPVEALAEYAKATSLDGNNAGAYLHTAVLQSRLHHVAEAQQAFDRAEGIYRREVNQEGLANLHYERGYAANVQGNSAQAKEFLNQSLHEAQEIPSVPLQIQTLQQLSSARVRYDAAEAATYATDAIRLARENRLDSLAAIGLVRLAGAQLRQGKSKEARETTNEGLQLAKQTQQLRVEALANSQLANLESQDGHYDEVIGPATLARDYYQKNGFFTSAAIGSLLIGRTQRDQGQYDAALQSAEVTSALAGRFGDRELMRSAEELYGTVKLAGEDYPSALAHFQHAKELADAESSRQYEAVFIARTLCKLGRGEEFETEIRFTPATPLLIVPVVKEKSCLLMTERRYGDALELIKKTLSEGGELVAKDRFELTGMQAVAEAYLHRASDAERDLAVYSSFWGKSDDQSATELASAEVELTVNSAKAAEEASRQASRRFRMRGQMDSELRSVALGAIAARRTGDLSALADFDARKVDIISEIRKTWGPTNSESYLSRRDIKELLGLSK